MHDVCPWGEAIIGLKKHILGIPRAHSSPHTFPCSVAIWPTATSCIGEAYPNSSLTCHEQ